MSKQVPCAHEICETRVNIEDFSEPPWLPVFKSTRQHMGFFCPACVEALRSGGPAAGTGLAERYLLSWTGPDEIIIDREPLEVTEKRYRELYGESGG